MKTKTANALGKRIVKLRTAKGLNQKMLARITGLDQGLLSRIEGGKSQPTIHSLRLLAIGLGCTLDCLDKGDCR